MAPRVDSELLLVGSLPADSADRRCGPPRVLPRPGVRAAGRRDRPPVSLGRLRAGTPGPAEPGRGGVQETESPTGIPRHAYETPVFGIQPGVTGLHWDSWPRIDDAIAGYQVFRRCAPTG